MHEEKKGRWGAVVEPFCMAIITSWWGGGAWKSSEPPLPLLVYDPRSSRNASTLLIIIVAIRILIINLQIFKPEILTTGLHL